MTANLLRTLREARRLLRRQRTNLAVRTMRPVTPGGFVVTDVLAYDLMGSHPSVCVQATDGTDVAIWWLPMSMIRIDVAAVPR